MYVCMYVYIYIYIYIYIYLFIIYTYVYVHTHNKSRTREACAGLPPLPAGPPTARSPETASEGNDKTGLVRNISFSKVYR